MNTQAPRGRGNPASPAASVEPAEFAEYLRAERERRRISLDQVSDETKIAKGHLAALERGDVRNWPGGMYRRAMMRAYAESIGVDREFALQQFDRAFEGTRVKPDAPVIPPEPPPSIVRTYTYRPLIAAFGVMAVIAAIATMIWPGEPSSADRREATVVAAAAPLTSVAPAPARPDVARASMPETLAATAGNAALKPEADARPLASEGRLVVESDPPGARVTVNGIGWGETPVTIRHVEFGEKRVRLTLHGYVSAERVVRLSPERGNATVHLALRARQ
jgi:cytoskeleton protein RodZ